jgi:hypothetical protein
MGWFGFGNGSRNGRRSAPEPEGDHAAAASDIAQGAAHGASNVAPFRARPLATATTGVRGGPTRSPLRPLLRGSRLPQA